MVGGVVVVVVVSMVVVTETAAAAAVVVVVVVASLSVGFPAFATVLLVQYAPLISFVEYCR